MRIALLGVSHWHLPLYLSGIPEGSIVGVSDENLNIAAAISNSYDCRFYKEYSHMILETKPDFVFAFAPHNKMKEVSLYLLDAGIPFSMEKPCGLNASEVGELYNTCEKKNGFISIPFIWRYSDTINELKSKYLKKQVIHMSYRFIAGPPSRYLATSKWMLSKETAGGGCMTNLGVHFIDMALYLTNCTRAEVLGSSYQYAKEYDIEVYATSLLQLSTGPSLLLETGYVYPMSEDKKRENRWTIVTENGYYTMAENKLELREFGVEPTCVAMNTDSDIYYGIYAKTTLGEMVAGIKPRASLKEMLDTARILDAMNQKAE